jgi:hypothetical protein
MANPKNGDNLRHPTLAHGAEKKAFAGSKVGR